MVAIAPDVVTVPVTITVTIRDQRDGQNRGRGHNKREGHQKQPHKCSAREEAHHMNEECSRSSEGSHVEAGSTPTVAPTMARPVGKLTTIWTRTGLMTVLRTNTSPTSRKSTTLLVLPTHVVSTEKPRQQMT